MTDNEIHSRTVCGVICTGIIYNSDNNESYTKEFLIMFFELKCILDNLKFYPILWSPTQSWFWFKKKTTISLLVCNYFETQSFITYNLPLYKKFWKIIIKRNSNYYADIISISLQRTAARWHYIFMSCFFLQENIKKNNQQMID